MAVEKVDHGGCSGGALAAMQIRKGKGPEKWGLFCCFYASTG
jgi:hypothetical protein